ncbi:AfsR/SARP family transcriptional regulator [Actinomadura sediminis]|uniref:BTAD domain-containing putative transcriptional regulator n=1 Tax=Actinomadura sediminis TaxID=1038904 RepID=A0ABW3EJE6_9ACTN
MSFLLRFELLGPLEILNKDTVVTPSTPKLRQVLALLSMRANQVVGMDVLVQELWDADPPRSAITTLQTYVCQLRRWLAESDPELHPEETLRTRPRGYVLQVDDDRLDVRVFERLVEDGERLSRAGRSGLAMERLAEAAGLWRGPVLADVTCGVLLKTHAAHLEELRLRAIELRVQTGMAMGQHRHLVAELQSLTATYPLNEWLHAQLMQALNRCGRRGDALKAYHGLRVVLAEELGVDPSPELKRLHEQLLRL